MRRMQHLMLRLELCCVVVAMSVLLLVLALMSLPLLLYMLVVAAAVLYAGGVDVNRCCWLFCHCCCYLKLSVFAFGASVGVI